MNALMRCGVSAVGLFWMTAGQAFGQFESLPEQITVGAVVRDFKASGSSGGHADFQSFSGPAARVGLVRTTLDVEGKPVLASTTGTLISNEWRDKNDRPIMPSLFNLAKGDKHGSYASSTPANITSANSFNSWYRDVPGVNMAKVVELTLKRKSGTNRYVIDSSVDEPWKSRGGFFPINKQLYGNYSSTGKNYHFTTEIEMVFTYDSKQENVFMFSGDDDLWVFIDGQLVMDLGGLHPRKEQYLDISRLDWLQDGLPHTLKIFHAERRTVDSNFRVETSLALKTVAPPSTTAMHD